MKFFTIAAVAATAFAMHEAVHIDHEECEVCIQDHSVPMPRRMPSNSVAPKEIRENVVVDPVMAAPVVVVVEENSPVYTVDPNGQAPYPNGLTMDIFFSCNDNKGFIAKRGNGIYTEIYNLKAAGQTKPKLNKN